MEQKDTVKYMIGLLTAIFIRLLPHPPNVEPVMSTMMPYAKRWGWLGGLIFTFLVMISFDLITGTLGIWSFMTIGTYCMLSVAAGLYFRERKSTVLNYVGFSVAATLAYDAITGIGTGMLFFGQPFMVTFMGQIPFTAYHLAGNIVLASMLSPALYRWVVDNPRLDLTLAQASRIFKYKT